MSFIKQSDGSALVHMRTPLLGEFMPCLHTSIPPPTLGHVRALLRLSTGT